MAIPTEATCPTRAITATAVTTATHPARRPPLPRPEEGRRSSSRSRRRRRHNRQSEYSGNMCR